MPYLYEWSALEEDYTHSLSGTTSALTNSLLRLPVSGNVQVPPCPGLFFSSLFCHCLSIYFGVNQ